MDIGEVLSVTCTMSHDTITFKAAYSLLFGLPSTRIRHENGAFRKRSSKWRNLKTVNLRFSEDKKINQLLLRFRISPMSVDGKYLMRFQSKTSVFNFLQRRNKRPRYVRN